MLACPSELRGDTYELLLVWCDKGWILKSSIPITGILSSHFVKIKCARILLWNKKNLPIQCIWISLSIGFQFSGHLQLCSLKLSCLLFLFLEFSAHLRVPSYRLPLTFRAHCLDGPTADVCPWSIKLRHEVLRCSKTSKLTTEFIFLSATNVLMGNFMSYFPLTQIVPEWIRSYCCCYYSPSVLRIHDFIQFTLR